MNERIKQLAELAGLEFDDDLTLEPEPIYYSTQNNLEKFAELIILECSRLAQNKANYIEAQANKFACDNEELDAAKSTAWQILVLEANQKTFRS